MEKEQDGKNWYFEGDELVIKKGKWIIDRYKKHLTPSSDKDRLESLHKKFQKEYMFPDGKVDCWEDDIWNWILSHAKELGELV